MVFYLCQLLRDERRCSMKKVLLFTLLCGFNALICKSERYDLTVVSQIRFACSLTRYGIGLIDVLQNDIKINHIKTPGAYEFVDVSESVQKIIKNPDKSPGNVAILLDFLWINTVTPSDFVPEKSSIKIAYSVFESSALPKKCVEILNNKFDLVVVPDEFCRPLYKEAGVTIPIFVVPHGIYVEELLREPVKKTSSTPFTFGLSAGFWPRKNQELLVDAFVAEFGNRGDVKLKLHGRAADESYLAKIQKKVQKQKIRNIEIIQKVFTGAEYNNFLKTLDCVVLLSKGEGFSIAPREALALGIPCIISDNSAHKTLNKTGFFYGVPSNLVEANSHELFGGAIGYDYNCKIEDVRKALRDVYIDYSYYVDKAHQGRPWVEQYLWKNLKQKFMNLIKPTKIVLGEENRVTDDYFMTTSPMLYKKYAQLINK